MTTMTIEAPGRHPEAVALTRFPCAIGRHEACVVRLPSWRVARHHAELRLHGRAISIVDLGSLGGTWINGERVNEFGPLTDEDEIRIAGFSLRLDGVTGLPGSGSSQLSTHEPLADADRAGAAEVAMSDNADSLLDARRRLHRELLARMDLRRQEIRHLDPIQLREQVGLLLDQLIEQDDAWRGSARAPTLRAAVLDEAVGLGVLEPLLARADITEIMVNGTAPLHIERAGLLEQTDLRFSSDDAIRSVIDRIVSPLGRRIDEASPMVDARLPDGSRVNAVIPPLALQGPIITIRRFNARRFTESDLVERGSASIAMMRFLGWCVENRCNIVVSGGTGSGKTTLLNVLSNRIPAGERILTIEDAAELRLGHRNLVSLEARPPNAENRGTVTIRDLVRNALRMRPDRIVVGECRGGEAIDMLQAMNTGHDGSLTTVHANSARDALARLEVMVLMSGVELPSIAIREQIASAVDLIVHQSRGRDGRRRIIEVVEVAGLESGRIQVQPLFRYGRLDDGTEGFLDALHVPALLDALDLPAGAPIRALFANAGGS
ncbi:MAG: ATPase, T2SS/T4P/T4SS family [Burkholderiaceae bacterium]